MPGQSLDISLKNLHLCDLKFQYETNPIPSPMTTD